jgi:hypothetical protein
MRVDAINGIQNNNQRSFSTGSFGGSSGFASIFDEKASLNNTKVKGNEAGLLATAMKKSEGISAQRFNHFYELAMARTKSGYYTEQANEPKDKNSTEWKDWAKKFNPDALKPTDTNTNQNIT